MFNIDLFESEIRKQVAQEKLSIKTAEYYISCINRLNEVCRGENFGSENIVKGIESLCNGNDQRLKFIAAVKKYERDILGSPKLLLYGEALTNLYAKSEVCMKGKKLSLSEGTYMKKINRLGNEKLKLAFRLEHSSGLRISEIANLKKDDIIFNEETRKITLKVLNGKRQKDRTVDVIQDEYLYNHLKNHLDRLEEDEMVFYSESYLKKKAVSHNIQTHDLRRVNARLRFRAEQSVGNPRRESRRQVAKQLGHSDVKTTNLYLGEDW